ncbi:hypothetical protein EV401DRAFT_1957217 [Pisolithus croceorrhizus]|nr:hypothetical protein EV401DRAFT_1957217 [Pisolithus croceorrhizus]
MHGRVQMIREARSIIVFYLTYLVQFRLTSVSLFPASAFLKCVVLPISHFHRLYLAWPLGLLMSSLIIQLCSVFREQREGTDNDLPCKQEPS